MFSTVSDVSHSWSCVRHSPRPLSEVDQPPGTGFSYTSTNKLLHELDAAADYIVEFLKNWYLTFPEYQDVDVSVH